MKFYALKENGDICGAEATVLDLRRGFYVCPGHSHLAVTPAEFRRRIAAAINEFEVKRIVLRDQEYLAGDASEIQEVLNFAFERELHFSGGAEGVRAVGVCA